MWPKDMAGWIALTTPWQSTVGLFEARAGVCQALRAGKVRPWDTIEALEYLEAIEDELVSRKVLYDVYVIYPQRDKPHLDGGPGGVQV